MRMLLQISLPVEKGNEAIRNQTIAKTIQGFQERWHPEALYFTTLGGTRTTVAVVDLAKESDLPAVLEPLFLELEADIVCAPAMNADDLAAGLSALR